FGPNMVGINARRSVSVASQHVIEADWECGFDSLNGEQQFTPTSVHFSACMVAEHVDRAIRVLAAARPNLAILHEVIKCASHCHEAFDYVVECCAHDRIADIRLGWQ